LQGAELLGNRLSNAGVHDQFQQGHIVKGRNLPRLIGLDVSVDQMPHVRLVSLQIKAFTAGLADNLPKPQVMVELLPDSGNVGAGVSGCLQFVGDVGVGTHQRGGRFVERSALWLPLLQVGGNLGVAAEVMHVFQLAPGRLHRLAQQGEGFQRIVEPLPAVLEAILHKHLQVGAPGTVIQF
jgi:hypothetical protein